LVAQYEARLALHEYVEQMWEQISPRSSAIAGLREVIAELLANAAAEPFHLVGPVT
jgi:hypothetical protein